MYIRYLFTFIIYISLVLLAGCTEQTSETVQLLSIKDYEVKYATTFSFFKTENESIVLKVRDPNNPNLNWQYVRSHEEHSKEFSVIPFSPERVSALSATHIGMMKALNLTNYIAGVSQKSLLCNKEESDRNFIENVFEVGFENQDNVERYILADTDLIIHSGFDPSSTTLKKIRQAGIPVLMNYEWKETHPLGRAEWIKVFGFIFGIEEEANALFMEIEKAYLMAKQNAEKNEINPSVLVGTIYGDIFNAPAGESYMAKLLQDAGANYVYAETEGVGSLNISLESLITNNTSTAIWLDAAASDINQLLQMNSKFSNLSSVTNKHVYGYYHDVNCFWEHSAISPHLVLQDVINILHDTNFEEGSFYKRLD